MRGQSAILKAGDWQMTSHWSKWLVEEGSRDEELNSVWWVRVNCDSVKVPGSGLTASRDISSGYTLQMISGFGQENCIKDEPKYQNRNGFLRVSI